LEFFNNNCGNGSLKISIRYLLKNTWFNFGYFNRRVTGDISNNIDYYFILNKEEVKDVENFKISSIIHIESINIKRGNLEPFATLQIN